MKMELSFVNPSMSRKTKSWRKSRDFLKNSNKESFQYDPLMNFFKRMSQSNQQIRIKD